MSIFRGVMLWEDTPGEQPHWKQGAWRITGGRIFRLADPLHEAKAGEEELRGFAVPGMADAHCHIGIDAEGGVDAAQELAQAQATLASGVTLVRDCGSPESHEDDPARASGLTIIRCGRHIARPTRYIRGLPIDVENQRDLPEVMAAQAARSDGWVKIVGDWIDRSQGGQADLSALWDVRALCDGVAAVHEAGARVAVHAFSHAVIDDLLEAGVDDIEHGSGIDEDQACEIARRGIGVAPTLRQVELFDVFAQQAGSKYPVYASTMRALYEGRREHIHMLENSGVLLLMGTDSGGYQEHGSIAGEMELWQQWGLSSQRVIDAATWQTRRFLGGAGLYEGAKADLIVTHQDVRADARLLASPDAVYASGQRII